MDNAKAPALPAVVNLAAYRAANPRPATSEGVAVFKARRPLSARDTQHRAAMLQHLATLSVPARTD